MTDPVGYVLAIGVLLAILALGVLITLGNERVRAATLEVRQVVHTYALADLALRREQAKRTIGFANEAECLRALEQITLDASRRRQAFLRVTVASGAVAALLAESREGLTCLFTPSAESFLKANPAFTRRIVAQQALNGLNAESFVVAELEAIARLHGLSVLPRTEEWDLLIIKAEDYSLLPRVGGFGWLRRKGG